jgi:uncharacterized protein YqgV (UPF0045/DUF77 family)
VRIRVEFTIEPFIEGTPGPHVKSALDQLRARGIEPDVGPFASTVEGEHHVILKALEPMITASLANGASNVALGVSKVRQPTDRDRAFIDALTPILDATGSEFVPLEKMRSADTPLHWQGELLGGLRLQQTPSDLHSGLDKLLNEVEEELGGELHLLNRAGKQRAARLLEARGAFRFRGAAEEVADAMGVSRVTVYNYLNAVRHTR